MPRAFTRYEGCPACGRPHLFALPPVDPIAHRYGYTCPATDRPAALIPWGPWDVSDGHPADAVRLRALHGDWASAPLAGPPPGLEA